MELTKYLHNSKNLLILPQKHAEGGFLSRRPTNNYKFPDP